MAIVVYEKRTCSTSRKLRELLRERGIEFEVIQFQETGLSVDEVRDLVVKTGEPASKLLRLREPGASELKGTDDETVIAAIAKDPVLLQRSVVVNGDRAVLARPVERALEII